jgi:hypothetical protein
MEELQQWIRTLQEMVKLANTAIENLLLVIESKDAIIFWLIISNIAQPTIVLMISFWGYALDAYEAYKQKKGR